MLTGAIIQIVNFKAGACLNKLELLAADIKCIQWEGKAIILCII